MRSYLILLFLFCLASCDSSSGGDGSQLPPIETIPASEAEVTDRVFFDLIAGGEAIGRIEFGLFGNQLPKTTENFRALATGEKGLGLGGKPLHFKGSVFHRIITGFMAQGGDITAGNGTGGESIYGQSFADESFRIRHSERGLLSMANRGPNTNSSQFFITFAATPWLDLRHVVFGKIVVGFEVLEKLEAWSSETGTPAAEIVIADSGSL